MQVGVDLVKGFQKLGSLVKYVRIVGNGRNALDFHIAYYLGQLATQTRDFHIISKDQGFDPLIKHMKGKGISCRRWPDLNGALKAVRPEPAEVVPKSLEEIAKWLMGLGEVPTRTSEKTEELAQRVSPITSKPATEGRIKTSHSEVLDSYQASLCKQDLFNPSYLLWASRHSFPMWVCWRPSSSET